MMYQDTICALATPQGIGALGIIRVSGEKSVEIVNSIFKGKNLKVVQSHTLNYGYIVNEKEIIDEVMVSVFLAPRTFTSENLVEISCHGSSYILQEILNLLVKKGCRLAIAGEFTQRAFLNGRIDLSQAEAVADLIASENKASHDMAISQMRGGFSSLLKELRIELLDLASLLELELDFSEEDVEFADRSQLIQLLNQILYEINPLIESFTYGNAIKNGVPVAIIGKPNAGKSTLLNALLNEDRAIVSDIAGTTRDTIEEFININGIQFRFIDTAGLRETQDAIEAIGVAKALEKANTAAIILYLVDIETLSWKEVEADLNRVKRENVFIILCLNKQDKNIDIENTELSKSTENKYPVIKISAKENINLELLKEEMYLYIEKQKASSQTIVNNTRHLNALLKAKESLELCKKGLQSGLSSELVAIDLRRALEALGEIIGQVSNDELLGNIFGKFCIGK
ncbi:tRNA uridine-5-carboxymethylaminomethyl(34) synthesis GTPase MnmE [Apibacter muscae]|uniref:tRNA uridine-5-carboxymethylaminomethyl(34) synthesis GTPase MnmE n=1 Tax=Apibacter muscae TaxID=2509004 RepID=UPI0011AC9A72|nr:tRNA uridine-5-carboxymethylaminomethyl(34) synthesis GTPase MnmE [Apibacter muscae]TWP30187.1 tRNA uridine-5-carboxymethylaminomethyl(34) synthesis GTPase MnmE [Apibacter muscae]